LQRLIDAYSEGLVDPGEFEPRLRAGRERLARLREGVQAEEAAAAQEHELRLVIGCLQAFAGREPA